MTFSKPASSDPTVQARTEELRRKVQAVKLLLLDVDGVLTDGGIVIDERGEEVTRFDVQDGQGVKLLQQAGIRVGLLTGRASRAVAVRAERLSIGLVYQNVSDKLRGYDRVKADTGLTDDEIAYVGDDMQDLPVLRRVVFAVAVKNAWDGLKAHADYVTTRGGGRGAVREVAELLLRLTGKWDALLKEYDR